MRWVSFPPFFLVRIIPLHSTVTLAPACQRGANSQRQWVEQPLFTDLEHWFAHPLLTFFPVSPYRYIL
uniref:Putative secreted protein n=1 Tax=Anopheles darlingi TaxID=43151 RepID=A0A2M4D733_ANODA